MTQSNVHRSHCCVKHGCKYGDYDCPVVDNTVVQKHPCEWCDDDDRFSANSLDSDRPTIDAVIGHRYLASDGSMWDCKGIDPEDLAFRRMYCSAAHNAQDVRRFFTNGRLQRLLCCYGAMTADDDDGDVHLVEDLGPTDKAFDWSSRPEHTKECWDKYHRGDHISNDELIQMIKSTKETLAYLTSRHDYVGQALIGMLHRDVITLEDFARARKLTF